MHGRSSAGSCTIAFAATGTHHLTATYGGDANFNGSASTPAVLHTVNKAATTTSITSDFPDPTAVNQSYTVTFSVAVTSPGAGSPTGNVTVSDGTDSCLGTVATGSCVLTSSTAGSKTLTATYAGSANFTGSVSAGAGHQVNLRTTSTSLSCATPVDAGATTSCNVTVTDTNGVGASTPTGTVTFSTDGSGSFDSPGTCTVVLGTCSIDYTVPSSTLATTDHIGAHYNGSAIHAASTATAVSVVIETHADLADLKSAVATVIAGDTLTYTITVTNIGPSDAQGVSLADTLDSHLTNPTWTLDTLAQGAWGGIAVLGPMIHGQTRTIVITATVDPATAGGYDIENTANAASATADPNPDNNASDTTTTVESDVTLDLNKSFDSATATAGGSSETFTITVTNTGDLSTAHDVRVTDTIDSRLAVTGIDCSAFDTDASSGQTVDCTIALLPAGDSATITVTYQVDTTTEAATAVSNTAHAGDRRQRWPDRHRQRHGRHRRERRPRRDQDLRSDTVTAGGVARTVTIAVHNDGVSQADHVSLTDTRRRPADRRLDRRGDYTAPPAPARPCDCTLANLDAGRDQVDHRHLPRRHHHRGRPRGRQHRVRRRRRLRRPGHRLRQRRHRRGRHAHGDQDLRSATVTAGGASQSFTIDVKNSGVSQADSISLGDLVERRPRRRHHRQRATSTAPPALARRSTAAWPTSMPASTKSITVSYSVDTTTEATTAVANTAAADADDFAGPATGSDSVDIVEDVTLAVTKAFGDDDGHRRRPERHLHHRRQEHGSEPGRQRQPDRPRRRPPDRRLRSTTATTLHRQHRRPDDRLQPGHLDAGRDQVDHRHLPRRRPTRRPIHPSATRPPPTPTTSSARPPAPTPSRSRPTPTLPTSRPTARIRVLAGNVLTYTITVTNNGPSDAQDVSLTDTLDPALTGETWTLDTVAQGSVDRDGAPRHDGAVGPTTSSSSPPPSTRPPRHRGHHNTATSTSTTDDPCDGIGESAKQQRDGDDGRRHRGRPEHQQDRRRPRPRPVIRRASTTPSPSTTSVRPTTPVASPSATRSTAA